MARKVKNLTWFNEQYKEIGYSIELSNGGHWKVTDPDGRFVTTVSKTPSDHRSMKNSEAAVRRHERNRAALAMVHAAAVRAK